jgi:hypothetical protein
MLTSTMRKKVRKWLISFLETWLFKLYRPLNVTEHETRLQQVRLFFHEILPSIDEKWSGKAIIEGGKFNYFQLPSGELPKYDFALPEIPLYVIVADIVSSDWDQARQRGIKRETWEQYQYDLEFIEKATPQLATIGMAAVPKVIIIRWNDPINHYSLAEQLQDSAK